MAKRKKVDFNLASEVFEDASLTDSFQEKHPRKTTVPITQLKTNPHQPRIELEQNAVIDLANSIAENGLLQPITVLENSDSTYTIVFGHRRVAAYEYLNKKEIEANILTSLEDKDLVISPIIENLQRKDMEPLETAMALNKVLKMGIVRTQEQLSNSLGISQGRVSKLLSILKLSDELLDRIKDTQYKDVTVLAAINKISKNDQIDIFEKIRILPRNEALIKIKEYTRKKHIKVKRVIHGNNNITINTKGLTKPIKEKIIAYIHEIELLLEKKEV
ncbi:ParB/RepB/Spo0J family partition protein [Sulfurimonas paralvinellae]|uniref:ParB/RepB/Spo0J family partition protein n=1 Tax=Sulfurimonas paralvinellae TaxID=317658 RepID=A0A7M1BAP0_9BACT|nr:ParB/RepB/Spo0J family partition protein [Sulfurimonas paralvinellae]QOP46817.1 ParB/RepB/Spo0J family partition protein [Sulfurimonas paralvinellae]